MQAGIEVVLPPESDLMRPTTLYGISEYNPMMIKLKVRKAELEGRLNAAIAAGNNAQNEMTFLRGAIDQNEYVLSTWIDAVPTDLRMAVGAHKHADPLFTMHAREVEIKPKKK